MIKRPVATVGFTLLFTLMAALWLGALPCAVIGAAVLALTVAVLFLRFRHSRQVAAILLTAAVGFGLMAANLYINAEPQRQLVGQSAHVAATVTEEPMHSNGRYIYELRADEISLESAPAKLKFMLVSADNLFAEAFDKIEADVCFFSFFDGYTYASDGMYVKAYVDAQIALVLKKAGILGTL